MGRMRSSNWEEARNFHFLMIVQMIAVPPTQAAITMSTVSVVRVILADDDDEGADDAVADASDASVVIVVLAIDIGVVVGEEEATTVGAWEVVTGEALEDVDDDDEGEGEEEDTKDNAPEAELLVGVAGFVRELRITLSRGLLAEADGEGVAEAAFEGACVLAD